MCHAVRIALTPAEKRAAQKWIGVMMPVYASIAFVLLTALILMQPSHDGGMVTAAKEAAAQSQAAGY